jgi:maltooligosyltrehalose trehalohydrolase
VREGRRREFVAFGWDPEQIPDPQDPATFERSKLVWDEVAEPPHAEILTWYRDLLQLRRTLPDLADDRMDAAEVSCSEEAGWLRMRRGRVEVVANLGPTRAVLPVARPVRVLLASDSLVELAGTMLTLPPDSVAILEQGDS